MKVKFRDINLDYTRVETVSLDVVVELENGQRIVLTEANNGLCINSEHQMNITLMSSNEIIIKK